MVCVFQSDIIHQSVMELIHSEDREQFKTQLQWDSQLPPDKREMTLQEVLLPGKQKQGTGMELLKILIIIENHI